jgi:hypothetical protein
LNNYPEHFIKSHIRKTFNRYFDKVNKIQIEKDKEKNNGEISIEKDHIFLDIPFYGKPTEVFRK